MGILDNRAATYCKLEQYDQARRDAKHMIKQAQDDERVSCFSYSSQAMASWLTY